MATKTRKSRAKPPVTRERPEPPRRIKMEKSIEQLAAEQGVKPMTNWSDYFGSARHLWESEDDFEDFLKAARRPFAERA